MPEAEPSRCPPPLTWQQARAVAGRLVAHFDLFSPATASGQRLFLDDGPEGHEGAVITKALARELKRRGYKVTIIPVRKPDGRLQAAQASSPAR